jgi:hypothetical protein
VRDLTLASPLNSRSEQRDRRCLLIGCKIPRVPKEIYASSMEVGGLTI